MTFESVSRRSALCLYISTTPGPILGSERHLFSSCSLQFFLPVSPHSVMEWSLSLHVIRWKSDVQIPLNHCSDQTGSICFLTKPFSLAKYQISTNNTIQEHYDSLDFIRTKSSEIKLQRRPVSFEMKRKKLSRKPNSDFSSPKSASVMWPEHRAGE
jgi:hypothetical protein